MRVLLVNPVVREWAQPNCFPTGLGYIAAVLQDAGHQVVVLDLNAERGRALSTVAEFDPEMVGLTGIITQYAEVKALAHICRVLWPKTRIVCGGPLATSVPTLLKRRTEITTTVEGEGEEIILDITKGWKKAGPYEPIKDLDSLPWPAYALFPMGVYLGNPIAADNRGKWEDGKWVGEKMVRKSMNMIGTRGCPFNCSFCYHNYLGQGYRMRSPAEIVKEMTFLNAVYGVQYIHFTDDAFACSEKFVMEFVLEKSLFLRDVTWSCAGRVNIMTDDLVKRMRDVGCEGLCFGLESGSQRMLDAMNKRATVEQYRRAITLNRKYFEYEDYTFIVGTPGDTWDTVRESVRFCKDEGVVPTAVFYMTPYPGTPLFKQLITKDLAFYKMAWDEDTFEQFILSLGEQGEQMVWNCTDRPDEEVREWHQFFLEETGAWNRTTGSSRR